MNFLHHYKIYCAKIIYDILQRVIMFTTSRLVLIKFLDKVVSHSRFMLTSTTSKANALKTAGLINLSKTSLLNTAARHTNATLTVGKRTQLLVIRWHRDCNKWYIILVYYNTFLVTAIKGIYTPYFHNKIWTIHEFSSSNSKP